MADKEVVNIERRRAKRYKIALKATWRAVRSKVVFSGMTFDISTSGLMLQCDTVHNLEVGEYVNINIAWPATMENGESLQLFWYGRIVRINVRFIAVAHGLHEFRTTAREKKIQ